MFIHIFKYRFKSLIRNKSMIFWTMIFPLLLATFFSLAFSGLNDHERFNTINIGIIDDDNYQNDYAFQALIQSLSQDEEPMFAAFLMKESEAKEKLVSSQIDGYIHVGSPMTLTVHQRGFNQSVIKLFLDQYSQTYSAVINIIEGDVTAVHGLVNSLEEGTEYTKEFQLSKANPDNTLMYFYALIAMSCLYGSFFGLREVIDIQADQSAHAARVNLSPVHKLKAFIYSGASSVLIHTTELMILLAYLHFGLGIDFGHQYGFVLFTTFIGSVVGITMGALIGVVVKGGEGIKTAICIGVSMLGSFLGGMMYGDMKYIIDQNVPIIGRLNPVNVLADAFYALYYYDDYERYSMNILNLIIFILVFSMIAYTIIRREKYASI
ncbi:ABC transporter permease [Petrocella atlantisensis]|uniref:ABC transporter permease n=1 Tax=Petrocella atlantisensis TaxID=2173034 RepID=A0A3P7P0B6_9FIRM|nr:ABC transporter permease [Petrocella atlantisensis]VDN48834.1 ABC transporter permease [Petrocella atlantisensis]